MNRLVDKDITRGFAIWLVVIGHIIQYNNCQGWIHHPVFEWIYSFHLPLFFYVSGFLTERNCRMDSMSDIPTYIWNKTRALIVPLLVWSLLFNKYFFAPSWDSVSIGDVWAVFSERGLWFLKYLYSISLLYGLARIGLHYCGQARIWKNVIAYLVIFVLLVLAANIGFKIILMSTALYFSFFMVGAIVAKYDSVRAVLEKPVVYAAAFVLFCILSTHCSTAGLLMDDVIKILVSCSAIVLFENISKRLEKVRYSNVVSTLGRYSLAIYCSHWFLLCLVSNRGWNIDDVNNVWIFLASAIVAMVISYSCIAFAKVIEGNRYLAFLFLGKRLKR